MTVRDTKNYHRDHAIHNNNAIKHMDKNPAFLDWVLTMCFYTSLHAVKHKAFPMEIPNSGGKKDIINCFEDYCTRFYQNRNSAHSRLSDLVNSYLQEISAEYSQLKDMCWNARYYDYNCDRDTSNLAKKHKDKIFKHCIKLTS